MQIGCIHLIRVVETAEHGNAEDCIYRADQGSCYFTNNIPCGKSPKCPLQSLVGDFLSFNGIVTITRKENNSLASRKIEDAVHSTLNV